MEKEETSWGSIAVLLVAGLVIVGLVWRSYQNDAPRVAAYQAPPARSAPPAAAMPQIETAQSLSALAESHFSAHRYEEAIEVYRKMLALDPKDAATYNELGLALHYTGKSEEALDALKKATALEPKEQRAWLSYGFVLKSMGREKPARAALEKVIALDPATAQGVEAKSMLKR
jgi:Flp pilus assembly protein TadD